MQRARWPKVLSLMIVKIYLLVEAEFKVKIYLLVEAEFEVKIYILVEAEFDKTWK